MGRSVSLFLVRASGILIAGMLLFAVFAHAHAENLDGYGIKPVTGGEIPNYGLVPLPGETTAAPAVTAANNSYNAAPVSGGYNAPMPYAPAPTNFSPAPQMQAPAYQPQPAATAAQDYGYRLVPIQQPQPQQQVAAAYQPPPPVAAPPINAQAAYGYKSGDGTPQGQVTPGQMSARANPDYVLGPGDKIKLTVFGETDLSGDFTLDGSGNLSLPLIGQVNAAGNTAGQLQATVVNAYAQGYLKAPRVSVEVSTYRPFYIIGAVNRPGEYPYVNHMNALNAIALAGGFNTTAVESVVFIRREGSNTETEMPTDRSTAIYPGDVIRVHNTFFADAMNLLAPLSGPAGIAAAATIH